MRKKIGYPSSDPDCPNALISEKGKTSIFACKT